MFGGIRFLNITRKSRNFHAFTQAYLTHAQTNFPAAQSPTIPPTENRGLWLRDWYANDLKNKGHANNPLSAWRPRKWLTLA